MMLSALDPLCLVVGTTAAWVRYAAGDDDAAFAALDQAWLDRDPALAAVHVEPRFEPLRSDPRFATLLERLNIRAGRT